MSLASPAAAPFPRPEAPPGLFRRHLPIILVLACLLAVRLPLLAHIPEYILLDQDYNPLHFGQLFWGQDWPALDDHEVGENARTLALSNAYYLLPTLLFKLGLPFGFWAGLQLLVGLPALLLGLYRLSYVLFGNPLLAALTALHFHVALWLFRLNVGYPLHFDQMLYSGDLNHIPASFFLAFLLAGRYARAGGTVLVLACLNPTYGFNGFLILAAVVGWLAVKKRSLDRASLTALLLAGAGLAAAWVMVSLATPVQAPVGQAVRDFSIRTYGHLVPHIFTRDWAVSMFFLAALLGLALAWERYFRPRTGDPGPAEVGTILNLLAALFILHGLLLYLLLYRYQPRLLILLTPSKICFFLIFVANAYLCRALYAGLSKPPPGSLLVVPYLFFLLYFGGLEGPAAAAVLLLSLVLLSAGLLKPHPSPTWTGQAPWLAVSALVLLTAWSAWATIYPLGEDRFKYARAFLDIQLKIKAALDRDSILVPYRLPEADNPYGPFTSFAMRTYSRRGALIFWSLGRNAYFNSRRRLEMEEAAFGPAGIKVWEEILAQAGEAKQEDPLLYYFGLRTRPCCSISKSTPPWRILLDKIQRLKSYLDGLTLPGYLDYARRLGASHVLVCRDPGQEVGGEVVVQNPSFAVVRIPDR